MPNAETHQDLEVIAFATMAQWVAWLREQHTRDAGLWVKLGKKGRDVRTITYEQTREGALMYGWIDGQRKTWDDDYFIIRVTPRRKRSRWSKINRGIAEELIAKKRMRKAGLAQVEAAKADGRWERAYDSHSTIQVPDDFAAALDANQKAKAAFEAIDRNNRYAFLYRIHDAIKPEAREKKIAKFVQMLARGELLHPPTKKKTAKKKVTKKKATKRK